MKTDIVINERVKDIVRELEFSGIEDLIKDTVMTEITCRVSNFSDEVDHFEKKYGKQFQSFSTEYEQGEEDFGKYDDLMAWRFAQEGKAYWENKLKELQNVL